MIPVYTEPTSIREMFPMPDQVEKCVFCATPTRTWHENTNNPCCVKCAAARKVSDFPKDWGKQVRRAKRKGAFDREDSKRAN